VLLHDLVEKDFGLNVVSWDTAVDDLSFGLVAGGIGVGWAGRDGVLGEADFGHLFNDFGSGDGFRSFVSSLRALARVSLTLLSLLTLLLFSSFSSFLAVLFAVLFAVTVIIVILVLSAFLAFLAITVIFIVFLAVAVGLVAAVLIAVELHSALLLVILTLALLVERRSVVFAFRVGADLFQVSWIFASLFLDGVLLVERSNVILEFEFGGSEFSISLEIVVAAETALNVSEEWAHMMLAE